MKTALICGVSGQDGAYLSDFLLRKGYQVFGGSRDAQANSFKNLRYLGINNKVEMVSINIHDFRSVIQVIKRVQPDEIYNLAGQTSVGLSFEQPIEAMESIGVGTLNLLEAIRYVDLPIRMYNAGSSECFGDTGETAADENTSFRPRSPYAVAKATAFWALANYREAYNLFACTGILFNHESPLRPERFVTKKIIATVARIAKGSSEKLVIGNINIARDWGWAPEYVEAMWLILQHHKPDDYVIATGTTLQLRDFIKIAFEQIGLDWNKHVEVDPKFFRPTDLAVGKANPTKAFEELGWKAKYNAGDVVKMMLDSEINKLSYK